MYQPLPPLTAESAQRLASEIRQAIIGLSFQAKTPHLASALSTVEILIAAYWETLNPEPIQAMAPNRDRFVFSKGHAAPALYVTLAKRGIIPESLLARFCEPGSPLSEQPTPHSVAGMEAATGSLGHGLPMGAGMALGARILGNDSHVMVLMSDGECNEGSVWEAAMLAPAKGLRNLMAIVDFNKWQATDRSREVLALDPLRAKFEAFGWEAHELDGHDVAALAARMRSWRSGANTKPVALIAHTVKGKGVSFMEDDNNWHYRIPKREEVEQANRELGLQVQP